MRKKLMRYVCILMAVLAVAGCKKAPLYDAVEQHWLLEEFTVLETQETVVCERLFYSITRMVTVLEEKQGPHGYAALVARTSYGEDRRTLVLSDFRMQAETSDSGEEVTVDRLLPFGIDNPVETVFRIVLVDGKQLVLESDYARLTFKKF